MTASYAVAVFDEAHTSRTPKPRRTKRGLAVQAAGGLFLDWHAMVKPPTWNLWPLLLAMGCLTERTQYASAMRRRLTPSGFRRGKPVKWAWDFRAQPPRRTRRGLRRRTWSAASRRTSGELARQTRASSRPTAAATPSA